MKITFPFLDRDIRVRGQHTKLHTDPDNSAKVLSKLESVNPKEKTASLCLLL